MVFPALFTPYYGTEPDDGLPDFSIDFDGGSQGLANSSFDMAGRTNISVSFWIKPDASETSVGIFQIPNVFRIYFSPANANRIQVDAYQTGAALTLNHITNAALSTGAWQHILVRWATNQNSGFAQVYRNGSEMGYTTRNAQTGALNNPASEVGQWASRVNFNNNFDGHIYQALVIKNFVNVSDVYDSGPKKNIQTVSGAYSLLNAAEGDATSDPLLSAWTEDTAPTTSTDIPT